MKDIITYCEIRKSFTRLEVLLFDRSCKKHKVVTQANNTNLFNLKKNIYIQRNKNKKQKKQKPAATKTTTTANYQRLIQNTVKDRTFCEND